MVRRCALVPAFALLQLLARCCMCATQEILVHVLPHSHCDPGYKKTVESYYLTEVRHILDSVVDALQQSEDRRFVWAEGVFLERWWVDRTGDELHQRRKEAFRKLVEEGRIEIVNGGFVMHDDAITLYDAQIRQTTLGHVGILESTLPKANPRIGYQIDPFGPSAFTPTFMALTGMDALIYNRIPDAMKEEMKQSRSLEFIWRGSDALSNDVSEVLVHVYDDHYSAPKGFDWEDSNNPPITADNVAEQADVFVNMMIEKRQFYRTPHLLVPFGTDFRHQNSSWQFYNMDQIVEHINANQKYYEEEFGVRIAVRYSTAGEYFKFLQDEGSSFPVLNGSPFLPLVSGDALTGAWSGFYTSYPRLKQMTRGVEMMLRSTRLMMMMSGLLKGKFISQAERTHLRNSLMTAERQVALLAHHDAIPATGYNFVNYDYERRMKVASGAMQELLLRSVRELLITRPNTCTTELTGVVGGGSAVAFNGIIADNVVITYSMGQPPVPLAVVNSLGWELKRIVHVPVSFGVYGDSALLQPDVMISDDSGTPILSQATPIPHTDGIYRISFEATVPPLGLRTYFLQTCYVTPFTDVDVTYNPHCSRNVTSVSAHTVYTDGIAAGNIKLRFSDATGDLSGIVFGSGGDTQELSVTHTFAEYLSEKDTVYHFKAPVGLAAEPTRNQHGVVEAHEGPLYSEVLVQYDTSHAVRYRIYNQTHQHGGNNNAGAGVEIEAMIGPLARFKTAVSRFSTSLNTGNRFFYDQNGYQRIEAKANSSLGVGCNFHPMTSRAWLLDEEDLAAAAESDRISAMTLVTSDVRGVTSLRSGELEVMWHRRSPHEEIRGNDQSSIRSSLWLNVGSGDAAEVTSKRMSKVVANDLMVVALTAGETVKKTGGSLLRDSLPPNAHVIALLDDASLNGLQQCLGGVAACGANRVSPAEQDGQTSVDSDHIYLQLEDLDEAATSRNVADRARDAQALDLSTFFRSHQVLDAESMGLSFYYSMAEVKARKRWRADGEEDGEAHGSGYDRYCSLTRHQLTLRPKQICSLRLRVQS